MYNLHHFHYLCKKFNDIENMAKVNRLKVVLVEKNKTSKWLAETLGKDPATISKWCTNTSQPSIETLLKIAKLLDVEINELVRPEGLDK